MRVSLRVKSGVAAVFSPGVCCVTKAIGVCFLSI